MIKGNNPTLLNVTYVRPNKSNDYTDKFEVVYKTDDGEVRRIEEPAEADIYIVKPEYRDYTYNKPQERTEKMDKVRAPIKDIRKIIQKESGDFGKQIMNRARDENDFKIMNQLYRWPFCYACDFQPEFYYMKNWYEKYQLKRPKLSVAFMDIETDILDYTVNMDDIPNTAHAPVNMITILLEETKEAWTFILRPYKPSRNGRSEKEYQERYALYEKQLKAHHELMHNKQKVLERIHKEFDDTYGYIHYEFREYEREIDLIADAFRLINLRKPNFCLIWNMRFDIQYLYYRIINLGYDPTSIMCHPDFPEKRCVFKLDKSTYKLEKQYDHFFCSSYTMFICQMRLYASIRKSQHKLKSVKLNAIAERELKDKKVEYPEAGNIRTFAYLDWILFYIYNLKDTLLQMGIERKTKDVITYYMRSHQNMTPYNKIFKETHLLRNVREMYFNQEGWVQGNNLNIIGDSVNEDSKVFYESDDDDDDDEKASYKGAINAEPKWNDYVGVEINGSRSNNIFKNSTDFDMGAFYPSIKIASNMDPGTLLYKAAFDNEEFISGEMPNRSLNTTYREKDKNGNMRNLDITGEAVNTYASGNILTMGYNYFGMPSMSELLREVERELH